MADTVNTRWLYPQNWDGNPPEDGRSGWRRYTVQLTNDSDGTGETGVRKVDISELRTTNGKVPTRTIIEKIRYDIGGMEGVELYWDRALAETITMLGAGQGEFCYKSVGGLADPSESGDRTGDIMLTTNNASDTDSYQIEVTFRVKE